MRALREKTPPTRWHLLLLPSERRNDSQEQEPIPMPTMPPRVYEIIDLEAEYRKALNASPEMKKIEDEFWRDVFKLMGFDLGHREREA